jgi:protein tyrosine phosphatase (PTP) superfamily phosphohydrolase (DUF442 family)
MGINFKNIGTGLKDLGKTVGNDLKHAGKAAETAVKDISQGKVGQAGTAAKNAVVDVGDSAFDGAAAGVGVAELTGITYPVTSYEAKVDDNLTRGSRLSDQDISRLHNQGFKSVVNLCMENDDDTSRAKGLGMSSLHLSILDNTAPSEAQTKQFLDFVTNPANQPAYVHCEAGQGRTGVMSAAYRMAVDGWTPQAAITEAKQMGMKLPDQLQFLQQFGKDLQAGKIAGYPLKTA